MRRATIAGRGLVVLSLAIAVYNIATAQDHWAAARREGAIFGGGIVGGAVGGAVAGLACGPAAPVCVTLFIFIGGTLGAFGVSMAFD